VFFCYLDSLATTISYWICKGITTAYQLYTEEGLSDHSGKAHDTSTLSSCTLFKSDSLKEVLIADVVINDSSIIFHCLRSMYLHADNLFTFWSKCTAQEFIFSWLLLVRMIMMYARFCITQNL